MEATGKGFACRQQRPHPLGWQLANAGGDAAGLLPPVQAAAINAQQLARMPEALPLLLALLEQGPGGVSDFYARYHTLQIIRGLAAMAPRQLQEVGAALLARSVRRWTMPG